MNNEERIHVSIPVQLKTFLIYKTSLPSVFTSLFNPWKERKGLKKMISWICMVSCLPLRLGAFFPPWSSFRSERVQSVSEKGGGHTHAHTREGEPTIQKFWLSFPSNRNEWFIKRTVFSKHPDCGATLVKGGGALLECGSRVRRTDRKTDRFASQERKREKCELL